jgi:hypothetical protein
MENECVKSSAVKLASFIFYLNYRNVLFDEIILFGIKHKGR